MTDDAIYFYLTPIDSLSNFSAYTIRIWGQTFYTVEHAFQWKKFAETNPAIAEEIKAAGSPAEAQKIAHAHKPDQPADWHEIKVGIMKDIIKAKVEQHAEFREALLSTGRKTLVEDSPVDSFWGCGADRQGLNKMGKILMEARDHLLNRRAGR